MIVLNIVMTTDICYQLNSETLAMASVWSLAMSKYEGEGLQENLLCMWHQVDGKLDAQGVVPDKGFQSPPL